MRNDYIIDSYFEWLVNLACGDRYSDKISFNKLLTYLHQTEFRYLIPRDKDRAEDGEALRYSFALEEGYDDIPVCLAGPCSVLEMMLALAIKCENIMDDPNRGDRTRQWFWNMIKSLGLGSVTDSRYNDIYVRETVNKFLNREYEPNGIGGLFTIRNCIDDLREVEIWHQLCWYLDTLT